MNYTYQDAFHRLYEEGHEVVGVELSELAVHSFFDKYYTGEYDQRTLDGVEEKLFSTRDGRLRIYRMDLFKFGPYALINVIIECIPINSIFLTFVNLVLCTVYYFVW